jgi:hypothetical protein
VNPEFLEVVDTEVNKKLQYFRMLGSCKIDALKEHNHQEYDKRPFVLTDKDYRYEQCMVTYIEGCEPLKRLTEPTPVEQDPMH